MLSQFGECLHAMAYRWQLAVLLGDGADNIARGGEEKAGAMGRGQPVQGLDDEGCSGLGFSASNVRSRPS